MSEADNTGYNRLEEQIEWYNKKSILAQHNYKTSKVFVIIASAAIPILALLNYNIAVACIGAAIVIAEGLAHVNQWQQNWLNYRSTCENLIHEKFAFIERIGPYDIDDAEQARKILVERAEGLMSSERTNWVTAQEKAAKTKAPAPAT